MFKPTANKVVSTPPGSEGNSCIKWMFRQTKKVPTYESEGNFTVIHFTELALMPIADLQIKPK